MNSKNPFQPGAAVSGYFRDSGGEGQELSIPQQEQAFRTWCSQAGLIVGAVFLDSARPGSSVVGRDGFHAMMDHFRRSAPEAGLVIWSYSRFARDFDDAAFYRADLRRRGYILHSLNDDIPDGNLGRLFEAVIDWKNAVFLEDLSRDVKRGLGNLVQQYGAIPGTPPRGFAREPIQVSTRRDGRPRIAHRWVPDPELVPMVQQAFSMLLAGASLADIQQATRLYRSINSWTTFFRNPLYKGVLEYGDLTIDDYCIPLVDVATWDQAQAIISKRAKITPGSAQHPRRAESAYLLSGLVYCARCGSPMSGSTEINKARNYRYERYICSRLRRNRDCDSEGVPRLFLEDLIRTAVRDYILDPTNLATLQELEISTEAERQQEIRQQAAALRVRLGNIRRKIGNITDNLAEEGRSRALLGKLTELETEEAELLAELARLDAQAQAVYQPLTVELLQERAELLKANLDSRILRGLIQRIVVDRDDLVVRVGIVYFFPLPDEHPPPVDTMSTDCATVGAPLLRHCYNLDLTVPFRRKKRVTRKKRPPA